MGLEWECVLLQGLHSASPRYTPAYALTAPNGALPDSNNQKNHTSAAWSSDMMVCHRTVMVTMPITML